MAFLLFSSLSHASPPTRVARLSSITGSVSFLAAGVEEWVSAVLNRPLTTWDRLWIDKNSTAKLQLGASTICIGENTSLTILNLDDRTAQFQMTEGRVNLNIQKIAPNQDYEIDTPNLAFVIQKPGHYRIDVDAEGNASIAVYTGAAEIIGEQLNYSMMENQALRFMGTDLKNPQTLELMKDELDLACFAPRPQVVRYVSNEMIGCEDLEEHGEWIPTDLYGQVWVPAGIDVDWVPYGAGEWVWIDPWGWTWIDAQPWGFAPFHYGRWAFLDSHWVWIPGPIAAIPVYAPALVEFINLENEIAWFPLGYNEIYVPPYFVTQNYFMNINISNTAILNKQIGNMYNNKKFNPTYMNMKIPNAVSAISHSAFINGESVLKHGKKLDNAAIANAKISPSPAVSPILQSITGGSKALSNVPAANVLNKATVSKKPPAALPVPFNEKTKLLQENKGTPLTVDQLKTLKTPKPAQNVKVIDLEKLKTVDSPKITEPKISVKPMAPVLPVAPVGNVKNPVIQEEQGRAAEAARIKAAAEAKRKAQESSEAAKVKAKQETQGKAIQEMQNKAVEDAQRRAAESAEAAKIRAAQEAQRRTVELERARAAEEVKQRAAESARIRAAQEAQSRATEAAKAAQGVQNKTIQQVPAGGVGAPKTFEKGREVKNKE
jgi:hypothetical protein